MSSAPTLDLNHEVRPQAGSVYDARGEWVPAGMQDRSYPATAVCVQCHRLAVVADGTADWSHAEVLARVGGLTGQQVTAAVAERPAEVGGTYRGMSLDRIYQVADVIEQVVLESRPAGTWWTIAKVERKGHLTREEATVTLTWMAENRYIITNGRGGCWVNYARKH